MDKDGHWLFAKFESEIEIKPYQGYELLRMIEEQMDIRYTTSHPKHARIAWESSPIWYSTFYDYAETDSKIERWLQGSELARHERIILESPDNSRVIEVETSFFINNWYDLTLSLVGLGCIAVSADFKCLLEFTDDAYFLLYTNFPLGD